MLFLPRRAKPRPNGEMIEHAQSNELPFQYLLSLIVSKLRAIRR
jgi:hypothetical protein